MNKIIKTMAIIWIRSLRYFWSALRHRKSLTDIAGMKLESYRAYIPETINQVGNTAKDLYKRFEWTSDGLTHLYDSLDTPASCWDRAFSNPPLKDDCDGFHAALYWATAFHFTCSLLTVVTSDIKESHSVLVIYHHEQYYLVNYTDISSPKPSFMDILEELLTTFYKDTDIRILAWELSQWNGRRWKQADSSFAAG